MTANNEISADMAIFRLDVGISGISKFEFNDCTSGFYQNNVGEETVPE